MMAPPAATTTTASVAGAPAPKTNQLPFIRKIGYAVNPFRLKHNKTITRVPFFINPDGYTRMWKGSHPGPVDPNRLPISFVLTAWRDKTHENKCEWPDTIKLELNRTIPIITKRKKAHVPGRPNNVFSYQGKDKPLDAGGYLNQGNNELTIEQLDCACSYYFAIIMYVRESEEIITNWVQSRILDINNGRGIVNRLLGVAGSNNNGDDDLEICQTNVKIGLKCPISLQRIKVPTKGRDCNHADVSLFSLIVNQ
ncbi:hypothetical protein BDB00DRAFT_815874 [Zychaea mexicana]|uniref:uncharacterized protein n=1 Tax=Zychaea mexicana TaxID=64656 RepID=UPI0022FE74BF|nr:uncharacterized protein BDB00DRAFT_815874 [Zychaea mexicana]KAI9495102.1 hypothetical protein BDB00DRAFT_815874 [Zychaea mexicana]